jgi:hypothetical protein
MEQTTRKKRNREFAALLNAFCKQCQNVAELTYAMPTNPPLKEIRGAVGALDALKAGLVKFLEENEAAARARAEADSGSPVNNIGGPF